MLSFSEKENGIVIFTILINDKQTNFFFLFSKTTCG